MHILTLIVCNVAAALMAVWQDTIGVEQSGGGSVASARGAVTTEEEEQGMSETEEDGIATEDDGATMEGGGPGKEDGGYTHITKAQSTINIVCSDEDVSTKRNEVTNHLKVG